MVADCIMHNNKKGQIVSNFVSNRIFIASKIHIVRHIFIMPYVTIISILIIVIAIIIMYIIRKNASVLIFTWGDVKVLTMAVELAYTKAVQMVEVTVDS